MVSVSPSPPRITSWCATSPGRRTEWIGTSPSIRPAVRSAVPEGASSLPSWCSSMISARAMWRDASAAKRIISTAPTAKLGAITALAGPASASARSSSTCSAVRPVVPMTACTPAASAARALAKTASGRVKSTSTSGPAPASAGRQVRVDPLARRERRVDGRGDPHVGLGLHGGHHRAAHPARGPRDADGDHLKTLCGCRPSCRAGIARASHDDLHQGAPPAPRGVGDGDPGEVRAGLPVDAHGSRVDPEQVGPVAAVLEAGWRAARAPIGAAGEPRARRPGRRSC